MNVFIAVARYTAAGGELTIKALYEVIKTIPRSQRKQCPCARRAARALLAQAQAQRDKHWSRHVTIDDDTLWQRWREGLRQAAIKRLTPALYPHVPGRASRYRCEIKVGKRAYLQVEDDLYTWTAKVVSPHGRRVLVSHNAHDVTYVVTVPYGWRRRVLQEGPGQTVWGRPGRTNHQEMTVLDAYPTEPVYGYQAWDVEVIARGRGVDAELVGGVVVDETYYVDRRAAMTFLANQEYVDETPAQKKRRLRREADHTLQEAEIAGAVGRLPDTRTIGGALERQIVRYHSTEKAVALARSISLSHPTLRYHARRGLRRIWKAREQERQKQRRQILSSLPWHSNFLDIAKTIPDRTHEEREETAQAILDAKASHMEKRLLTR